MKRRPKTILLTIGVGAAWVCAVAVGLEVLFNYETTAGTTGTVSKQWPAAAAIKLDSGAPTLIMFAHPQCPCTRASMDEFAQIMARSQGKVRAYILFYTSKQAGADWENSELRRSAAQIPGVTVLSDLDGTEAQRFGAETSGHTFLFSPDGSLLFNGGITGSRGHSGDNLGESTVVSLINKTAPAQKQTLVFGCSINKHAAASKGVACLK